jgi:mRNA interferase RelE/StbE
VNYAVRILARAERQLKGLDRQTYERIKEKFLDLSINPRPPGCTKLADRDGWRIRSGNYRILYDIDDAAKVVLVLEVGHRREIYR